MSEKEYIFVGNAQLKTRDYIKQLEKENKQLHSIIKEVREYIENYNIGMPYDHFVMKESLLEILDKENK